MAVLAFIALLAVPLGFTLRVLYVYFIISTKGCKKLETASSRTILCVGSGGHTTELLRLMKSLDSKKYQPRLYIAAQNDVTSEVKIHTFERDNYGKSYNGYSFYRITRSRNVNQSYLSSILSTLHATLDTIPLIHNFKPDLILCNGPGTCIPICVVAFMMRCLFRLDCRIIFVESICRVRTLSWTGQILKHIADVFVVQWPELRDVCSRAKYFGRLT